VRAVHVGGATVSLSTKSRIAGLGALIAAFGIILGWRALHSDPAPSHAAPGEPSAAASPPEEAPELPRVRTTPADVPRPSAVRAEPRTELPRQPETPVVSADLAELRRPVISAIRGDFPTPGARREAMRTALEGTGPTEEPWAAQASKVFDGWRDALPMKQSANTKFSDLRCYRAGCVVTVRFNDRETYEAAAKAFRGLAGEDARHGGRIQSPPDVEAGGQVTALWMMLRPDAGEAAADDAAG
jgi:hypothetical protein